jgi:hypothetical protein
MQGALWWFILSARVAIVEPSLSVFSPRIFHFIIMFYIVTAVWGKLAMGPVVSFVPRVVDNLSTAAPVVRRYFSTAAPAIRRQRSSAAAAVV